jgi:ribonucleoside-diphosphate reductase alpha chain
MNPEYVIKRGGTKQKFDQEKIKRALRSAFSVVKQVDQKDESIIDSVLNSIINALGDEDSISVEEIQDIVEEQLLDMDLHKEAKEYILWRENRKKIRTNRAKPDSKAISEYIHVSKYSRFNPALFRREIYSETVDRVKNMHLKRFPQIKEEIEWAFQFVMDKKIFPSMRSMQFAGEAIEKNNLRIFNCSFSFCDRPRFFQDVFYLLLCGCGVGYSVQKQHVTKLPIVQKIDIAKVNHHLIQDSIEGWADALGALINSYFVTGEYIEFAYNLIRPRGSVLVTSGGKAPGHYFLKKSLEQIRSLLNECQGRKIKPIEAHDVLCIAADSVLSGGIRRSAMLSLFSSDDEQMMTCKMGTWYDKHGYRANANNSAVLLRKKTRRGTFSHIYACAREWGDPGVWFTDNTEIGINPCGEAGLNPLLIVKEAHLERLRKAGLNSKVGDKEVGFQFCNLTETNASMFKTPQDMYDAVKAASIIGTLQATYTKFDYLGPISEIITEQEALIGVSMTGMVDSPEIAFNPEYQKEAARIVVETNKELSAKLGIQSAARCTCIKPSGNSSLSFGGVGSGIGAHHARRYFRRVQANPIDPVYKYFKSINPHMCTPVKTDQDIITFCIEAPENAITVENQTAVQALDLVVSTIKNYILPATARTDITPEGRHNVSNTIYVKDEEWELIEDYIWDHRDVLSGVTLLRTVSDKQFQNAPREAVTTEEDENKWNWLLSKYKEVDYSQMIEDDDNTNLKGEGACIGGVCNL